MNVVRQTMAQGWSLGKASLEKGLSWRVPGGRG